MRWSGLKRAAETRAEWLITLPSLVWLLILFAIPTILVFAIAFKPTDTMGGVSAGWTLNTFRDCARLSYLIMAWRTLWMSVVTTIACLVLGIPAALYIAQAKPQAREKLLLVVIIPFWTNFLVRVYAWKFLLHPDGPFKMLLQSLGLAKENTQLLYNPGAVLIVLVYTYLPFAILPLYAAAEKFDFHLLEAARDLGASSWSAYLYIFIPGIYRGILTAILVVFIPALGSYVIPELVGGTGSEMIGNAIAQRTFNDRNLPAASALSALLSLAILLPVIVMVVMRRQDKDTRQTGGWLQ